MTVANTVTARQVEAAAQALCAWPSVAIDDREHGTATHMAHDALTAAARTQPPLVARADVALFLVWAALTARALARRSSPATTAAFAFAAGERWRGAGPVVATAVRRQR